MKKKLSLMLALLALTGVVVSCGETKTDPKTTDTDAGKTTETEPAETRTPHKVPVDTLDFNKEEYNMLFSEWGPYNYYFFAEENSQDGDVMNDALYKRQLDIEEALNVKIVPEYAPDYISGTPEDLAGDGSCG